MKIVKALAVSSVFFALNACTGHSGNENDIQSFGDDETTAKSALSDPYTALGTESEESQFGDDEVASVASDETPVSDSFAPSDSENADQPTSPDCDVYAVFMRWGQLTGVNRSVQSATNWSGDIQANVGTLSVIRTVAFDINDSLSPRVDPKQIDFTSHTRPHFDGLRIRYEVCDADKASLASGEEPTLTFNAADAPLTKSYTATELTKMNDLVVDVNASLDRFQAQSVKKSDLCQGTMDGQWTQKGSDYGVFKGIVVATNGIRVGYVKGFFGQVNGESKWVAKFISNAGRFGGIMEGDYADNQFSGNILNRNKGTIGSVDGSYVLPSNEGELGTFSANYTLNCANVPQQSE